MSWMRLILPCLFQRLTAEANDLRHILCFGLRACCSASLRNYPSMPVRQAALCDIRVFFQEYTLQRLKCSDRNSFEKPDPDPEGGWKGQFRLIPTVVRRVFAAPGTGAFLILKRFECAGPFSKFYIKGRFYAAI